MEGILSLSARNKSWQVKCQKIDQEIDGDNVIVITVFLITGFEWLKSMPLGE